MAARYFVGGGTGDWNSTTNWSATDGGASGASSPIAGDDVYLTLLSGINTLTVNVVSACTSINCTGFIGTLAGSSTLTVAGNITLGAAMTNNYTGVLAWTATSTLNTNGINVHTLSTSTGGITYTIASNIVITNLWNCVSTGGININGAFNINVQGTWSCNTTSANITFTNTTVSLTGNSTWQGHATGGNVIIGGNITINCTTLTITNFNSIGLNTTLTHTAGTVTTTSSTLILRGAGITLNTSGITWNNISLITAVSSTTLTSQLNVSGTFTCGIVSTLNGSTLNITGSMTFGSTLSGTTNIVLSGTGTWNHTASVNLTNNLTINTAGTITLGSSVRYATGTLTYTAGTVNTTTNNNTLTLTGSATLNTNGINWNIVTISAAATITINSLLTINGTLTLPNAAVTFAGTNGFTAGALTNTTLTLPRTYTFASTRTYTIVSVFNSNTNTVTNRPLFKSSVGGSQAILTLNTGATQDLKFVNATDIDSSLGQTINSNKAVLNNATNWYRTNGTFMYLMQ